MTKGNSMKSVRKQKLNYGLFKNRDYETLASFLRSAETQGYFASRTQDGFRWSVLDEVEVVMTAPEDNAMISGVPVFRMFKKPEENPTLSHTVLMWVDRLFKEKYLELGGGFGIDGRTPLQVQKFSFSQVPELTQYYGETQTLNQLPAAQPTPAAQLNAALATTQPVNIPQAAPEPEPVPVANQEKQEAPVKQEAEVKETSPASENHVDQEEFASVVNEVFD
jgi:hypothetical protein